MHINHYAAAKQGFAAFEKLFKNPGAIQPVKYHRLKPGGMKYVFQSCNNQ